MKTPKINAMAIMLLSVLSLALLNCSNADIIRPEKENVLPDSSMGNAVAYHI